MSELGNKRPIPSRAFNLVASALSPSRNTSIAWKPTFTGGGGQIKVTFSPGTVNGLLPSNMFEEFSVVDSTTQYVLLNVTGGEQGPEDVTIEVTTDTEVTNEYQENYPPAEFKIVLGVLNGTSYSMTASGPIGLVPVIAYLEDKDDPQAGENPYKIFYTWVVA